MRDQAADGNSRKGVEQREHRFEHRAADVFEIDVDPLRAGVLQFRREIGIAVIETVIEAEFILDVGALVLAAGDADRARALDACDLADGRADRAGSGGDNYSLASLRLADIEQARIRGHAGHTEHADSGRDRRDLGIDLGQALAVGDGVCLPAGARQHDVALGKGGIVGRDHLADGAAFHHAIDRHRLRIGRPVAHAAAHVGIERQPDGAQEDFSGARCRNGAILKAEVGGFGFADGTGCEDDAFALGHDGSSECYCCSSLRA